MRAAWPCVARQALAIFAQSWRTPGVGAVVPGALLQPEAPWPGLAQGQQHLGVWLGLPVFPQRPMHAEVGDHAFRDEGGQHVGAGEGGGLSGQQLGRQRKLHLTREPGVASSLARPHLVPQHFPVAPALGRPAGRQHLGQDWLYAALGGKRGHAIERAE